MRVVNAFVYALITALGAIVTAGKVPEDIVAWCGLALAVVTAGWGKYTQDPGLIGPNRKPWSEEQRRAAAGMPPKRPATE